MAAEVLDRVWLLNTTEQEVYDVACSQVVVPKRGSDGEILLFGNRVYASRREALLAMGEWCRAEAEFLSRKAVELGLQAAEEGE